MTLATPERNLVGEGRGVREAVFPNVFSYTPQQDTRDYIYSVEALATLEGKKFHSKRNHIARFFRNYPEAYIKPIDEETIPDALKAVGIPAVEVHISDPDLREPYRRISYIRDACVKTIKGLGTDGYLRAVDFLTDG